MLAVLESLNKEDVGSGRIMAEGYQCFVLGIPVPPASLLEGRELQDDDALSRPHPVYDFIGVADHYWTAAISGFDRCRLLGVLDVQVGVVHVEQDHCVAVCHQGNCRDGR